MRNTIGMNQPQKKSVAMAKWWFDNMTLYINLLKTIEDDLAFKIRDDLNNEIVSSRLTLSVYCVLMGLILLLCPVIIYFLHKLTSGIHKFAIG